MAEARFGGGVELLEMDGVEAVCEGGSVVGGKVVADVEDGVGLDLQRGEDVVEQPVAFAAAMLGRHEHAVDQREHVVARRSGDMRAQLGFGEVHVAD